MAPGGSPAAHCGLDLPAELTELAFSAPVSLENVLLDVKELQRGMDLTKREYTMHDHNTLLKDFILSNEGRLKKLQDDAKIAQVGTCVLDPKKPWWGPSRTPGELALDFRGNCPLSAEGRILM